MRAGWGQRQIQLPVTDLSEVDHLSLEFIEVLGVTEQPSSKPEAMQPCTEESQTVYTEENVWCGEKMFSGMT